MTSVTDKSFDEIIKEHSSELKESQIIMLEILLKEIVTYKYTTFSQLNGAINNHLNRLKAKDNEHS